MDYVIRPELRLVECMAFGIFSDSDLRGEQLKLRRDPLFRSTFRQLVDLSKVTVFSVSPNVLRRIAAASIFEPHVCRAIVAPSDLGFGLARMFDAFSHNAGRHRVMAFRNRASAMSWLESAEKPAA